MLASGALRTVQICMLFIGICLFGCAPPVDVPPVEPATLTPAAMYPGEEILVELTGGETDFSECENLADWESQTTAYLSFYFLFFTAESHLRQSQIRLASIEYVSQTRVAMRLSLGDLVPEGTYQMEFQCRRDKLLTATFFVRQKSQEYSLQFEPGFLVNGKSGQEINVSLKGGDDDTQPRFDGEPSSIFFSVGEEDVTVTDMKINDERTVVTVNANVSELALGVGEDPKAVDVMMVSWPNVYLGKIYIFPGEHPTISVSPGRVERPLHNTAPVFYDLVITSKDVSFKTPDAYAGTMPYLSFDFPQNPGLKVLEDTCTVSPADYLQAYCTISVDNSAFLGPAALKIRRGGMESYASVNVVPRSFADFDVHLSPPMIPNCACAAARSNCQQDADCPEQLVFVEPVGFEFDTDWTVDVVDDEIELTYLQRLAPDYWALRFSDTGGTGVDSVKLHFSNGVDEVNTHLLIENVDGRALMHVEDQNRGIDDEMLVYLQRGEFFYEATAAANAYSGVRAADKPHIADENDSDGEDIDPLEYILMDQLRVTDDAPTGPAALRVSNDDSVVHSEDFFRVVQPAFPVAPWISSTPDILWLKKQTAIIVFEGKGGFDFEDDTRVLLNDSSILISSMVIDSAANTATLTLDISRSAKRGIKTFYFQSGGVSAAANIRAEEEDTIVFARMKSRTISRLEGLGKVFAVLDSTYVGKPIGIAVFDNIGVTVERYYTTSEDQQETGIAIVFSVDPTGPGGWFGVHVTVDGRHFVMPVEIKDAVDDEGNPDTSLTANLTEYAVPGAHRKEDMVIQLPPLPPSDNPSLLGSLVTRISPIVEGYDVAVDHIAEEGGIAARIIADFSYNLARSTELSIYNPQIPLGVTASQGAAVGLWTIADDNKTETTTKRMETTDPKTATIYESSNTSNAVITVYFPWEYQTTYNPSKTVFLKISSTLAPPQVNQNSTDTETAVNVFTPITTRLLSSDKMGSLTESVDGVLWTFRDAQFLLWASNRTEQTSVDTSDAFTINFTPMGILGETRQAGITSDINGDASFTIADGDVCADPRLYFERLEDYYLYEDPDDPGKISKDPYIDLFDFPSTASDCRLAVAVSARTLDPFGLQTPDTALTVCDSDDNCVTADNSLSGGPDPILYVNAAEAAQLYVDSSMGTFGYYMLNIRSNAVIRQVSTETGRRYIELQMEPGAALDNCTLSRFWWNSTDESTASLALSGTVPADGRVFVTASSEIPQTVADVTGVTAIAPLSNFSLELRCDDALTDALQVGTGFETAAVEILETNVFPFSNAYCFARIGNGVDTNDNQYDFIRKSDCTVIP